MDNSENIKRSKRKYGEFYNKVNVNVQINRDLIVRLKKELKGEISLKSFIENLIKEKIDAKF